MPPYKNDQGHACHELTGYLSPEEVDPEDKGETHDEPAQEVAQGDQQHDPLVELKVQVSSVQESAVPSGKPFVVPPANVAREEDE